MDGLHERLDVLRRRVLRDAVAQVEYVPRPVAESVENALRFGADHAGRGEENVGVEVALQSHLVAHQPACQAMSASYTLW